MPPPGARRRIGVATAALGFVVLGAGWAAGGSDHSPRVTEPRTVTGSPEKLLLHYERWKREVAASLDKLVLPLAWSRARSVEFTAATGHAQVDAAAARVVVTVQGLTFTDTVEVWLLPFEPPASDRGNTLPAATATVHLGTIELVEGQGALQVRLSDSLRSVGLDALVVSKAGQDPFEGGLLFGSPTLFERMASLESRATASLVGADIGGLHLGPVERAWHATSAPRWRPRDVEALVALGEDRFFKETFGGNGRTCGSCHPAENNFTLDPEFIATLPPTDPLFVAEFTPALDSSQNGGRVFENPILMRRFGLIVTNLDGFDDTANRFAMRGVPHVLGLANTIERNPDLDSPKRQLTGWSGDGAPGTGTLREFSLGAVRQHMTRTMARIEGFDFRAPTPLELNALEAFLLSLGRVGEPDVTRMQFRDPDVTLGLGAFQVEGGCMLCHANGGSEFLFGGFTFTENTAVEAFTQNHPDGTGQPRPPDGGAGTNPDGGFESILRNADGSFGNGRFRSQSLIELADTLPAFHSNLTALGDAVVTNTVEGAIRFYTSSEFANQIFEVDLSAAQVAAMGKFLRVLNALENIRTVEEYVHRAQEDLVSAEPDRLRITRLVTLAGMECQDALDVLGEVGLHPSARLAISNAQRWLEIAKRGSFVARLAAVQAALSFLRLARDDMVE